MIGSGLFPERQRCKRVIDDATDLLAVGCILAFTDIDSNERHIFSPDAAGLFSATLGAAFETSAYASF